MGFFSKLGSVVSSGLSLVANVGRSPLGSFIPGASLAAGTIGAARMLSGGGSSGVPALPTPPGWVPGLPASAQRAAPGRGRLPMGIGNFDPNPGWIPRGPGGKMQIPFTGSSTPDALKQWSLDDQFLRVYYRAPKGYVVIRDANGKPFPVMKSAAKAFGLWKPAKKPPISVRDWSALKRSSSVIKKLTKVTKRAESIANYKAGRTRTKTKYVTAPVKC